MATQTTARVALAARQKFRRLPAVDVPNVSEPELARSLEAVKEHLRMYEGDSNAPKERFVTIAELENAGLITAETKNRFSFIAQVQGVDVSPPAGSTAGAKATRPVPAIRLGQLTDADDSNRAIDSFLRYTGSQWEDYLLFDAQNTWNKPQQFQRPISLLEQASGPAAISDLVFIWAKDGTPNTLFYTDDTGTEFQIGGIGVSSVPDGTIDDTMLRWDTTAAAWEEETQLRISEDGRLRIYDTGLTDFLEAYHDATDFNFDFTNTTDLNITGLTSIQAGTVDADFDAITATSYGGILEANLLDKSTTETITEDWAFQGNIDIQGGNSFQIRDPTDADRILIIHDGADVIFSHVGTTNWVVTGIAGLNVVNYNFDVDQTVGAGQDNFVLTYDDSSGLISLEAAAAGGAQISGTPVDNQLAIWTDATTIEGDANLTWDGAALQVGGSIQVANSQGARLRNVAASSTQPTIVIDRTDLDTGLGDGTSRQSPNALNIIVGGVAGTTWGRSSSSNVIINEQIASKTASTTQTQGQGLLDGAAYTRVNVVANANDVVTLPVGIFGDRQVVMNAGAFILQVFPTAGDDLGAGVDVPVFIPVGETIEWIASVTASTWHEIGASGGAALTRIAGASGAAGADLTWQNLTSDATSVTSTLAAKMTTTGVRPGTWKFKYTIIYQSSSTTVGVQFGINHTGTTGEFAARRDYISVGQAASGGIADGNTAVAAAALVEGKAGNAINAVIGSTTTGVSVANEDIIEVIEGIVVVTATGSLELLMAREAAAGTITIKADSCLELMKIE